MSVRRLLVLSCLGLLFVGGCRKPAPAPPPPPPPAPAPTPITPSTITVITPLPSLPATATPKVQEASQLPPKPQLPAKPAPKRRRRHKPDTVVASTTGTSATPATTAASSSPSAGSATTPPTSGTGTSTASPPEAASDHAQPASGAPTAQQELPALGQLSTGTAISDRERGRLLEDIEAQETRLKKEPAGTAAESRPELTQAQTFLLRAREAVNQNDLDGASTLTTKARVLLDELEKQ